jgi:hypothetical protein
MKIKGLNETHLLSLLQKALSRTTADAQLATTIYTEVEREVRLTKDLKSFEKFCEEGALPNLAPETVAELKSELSAKFGRVLYRFRFRCRKIQNWFGCWLGAKTSHQRKQRERLLQSRRNSGQQRMDKSCCGAGLDAVLQSLSPMSRRQCFWRADSSGTISNLSRWRP